MSHFKTILTAAFCTTTLASTGWAQTEFSSGFTIDGQARLAYIWNGDIGDGDTAFYGDTDLSWSSGTFGVDGSLIGYGEDGDSDYTYYLALSYTFGDHKLSIGKPRSAYDQYGRMAAGDYNLLFAVSEPALLGGISVLTLEELYDSDPPFIYGLRYDGDFGAGKVAVSYHGSNDTDVDILAVSGMYDFGSSAIYGGVEVVDTSSSTYTNAKLRYVWTADVWSVGVGATYVDQGSSDPYTAFEIAGDYKFTDQISAGGLYSGFSFGSSDYQFIGLKGSYGITDAASANLAVLNRLNDGSDNQLWELNVRYDF